MFRESTATYQASPAGAGDDGGLAGGTGGDDPASYDDDSFRLGEPELDRHHLKLLRHLKHLLATRWRDDREQMAAAASDLFEAWMVHCRAEKALMHASGWAEQKAHLADHSRLTLALSTLLCRQAQAEDSAGLEQMASFFVGYLQEHLQRFDRPLAMHLLRRDRS